MEAFNGRNISESWGQSRKKNGYACVLLSHQKRDTEYTKKITDNLRENGIDVYLDKYNEDLKDTNQYSNPNNVTQAILKGINASIHMPVVDSRATVYSNWVSLEIGFGLDKTELGVFTIKEIEKGKFSSYLRTAKRIRDIYDINLFVERFTEKKEEELINGFVFESWGSSYHALKDIMDDIISGEN